MMIYKARQGLRDRLFLQNKKENLFYSFQAHVACVVFSNEASCLEGIGALLFPHKIGLSTLAVLGVSTRNTELT